MTVQAAVVAVQPAVVTVQSADAHAVHSPLKPAFHMQQELPVHA